MLVLAVPLNAPFHTIASTRQATVPLTAYAGRSTFRFSEHVTILKRSGLPLGRSNDSAASAATSATSDAGNDDGTKGVLISRALQRASGHSCVPLLMRLLAYASPRVARAGP